MKNSEIAEIVRKVWENKKEHAGGLLDTIWKTIYYRVYKKVNDEQEAEDLTQEISLYIYQHIDELKSAEAFNAWMNAIISGFCNKRIKQLGKFNSLFVNLEKATAMEDEKGNLADLMLSKEQQEIVMEMIKGLSQKQRDVVLLHYYQQLPLANISEILGCSLSAVKNRLFTARRIMKTQLRKKDTKGMKQHGFGFTTVLVTSFKIEEAEILSENLCKQLIK